MAEKFQKLAAVLSAEDNGLENVEIKYADGCADGTHDILMNAQIASEAETPQKDETEESDVKEIDWSLGPDGSGSDTERADEQDDDPSLWTVKGRELEYNDLQQAVSESEMDYPDDTSGDNLAEMLRSAASAPDTDEQDTENDESDVSKESDTNEQNDGVSDEYLIREGVKAKHVEDVKVQREKYGICGAEGCEYGCQEGSDTCASHNESDMQEEIPAKTRNLSELSDSELKSVESLIQEGKSKDEAIRMI